MKEAEPDKALKSLMESTSEKLASEIINGKYSYCYSPADPEAQGPVGAPRSIEPETIFSPLANVTPECHAGFMKLKKMLFFGPYLDFLNFFVLPDDAFEVATNQWVTLVYWDKKKRDVQKSQPQPYNEFVQELHLAHEFMNLSAMIQDHLAE